MREVFFKISRELFGEGKHWDEICAKHNLHSNLILVVNWEEVYDQQVGDIYGLDYYDDYLSNEQRIYIKLLRKKKKEFKNTVAINDV